MDTIGHEGHENFERKWVSQNIGRKLEEERCESVQILRMLYEKGKMVKYFFEIWPCMDNRTSYE